LLNRKIIIGVIITIIIIGVLSAIFSAGFLSNPKTGVNSTASIPTAPLPTRHYTVELKETVGPAAKP